MAEALIKGLISSKLLAPEAIIVSDCDQKKLAHLSDTYKVSVFNSNTEVAASADILILAVKPADITAIVQETATELTEESGKLIISIAAGIRSDYIFDTIKKVIPNPASIIRAMPNTPALIGAGATGLFRGKNVTDDALSIALEVFSAIGEVITVDNENLLNAVTGLSGSGPAYVLLFMEAMISAGVDLGLSEEDAKTLVLQTTLGSAMLAKESDKELAELREMVTSPGGTTMKGLELLNSNNLPRIIKEAVAAATERAKELAKG